MKMPNLLRYPLSFLAGFGLTGLSWACWAWRTVACTNGRFGTVGLIAGAEEMVTLLAVIIVARCRNHWFTAGCCLGAGVGAAAATAWR